jgi:hypothetical protein
MHIDHEISSRNLHEFIVVSNQNITRVQISVGEIV